MKLASFIITAAVAFGCSVIVACAVVMLAVPPHRASDYVYAGFDFWVAFVLMVKERREAKGSF